MVTMLARSGVQVPAPTNDDKARQVQQQRAWDAYRGKFIQHFAIQKGEPDFNVNSNRCGPVVNTGMYLLFGAPVGIELSDDAPDGAADYLKAAWGDEDEMMVFCEEMAISAAVNGQTFVQIIPPVQDDDGDTDYARFVLVDPATVSVRTDPNDCKAVSMFIIDTQTPGQQFVYHRQVYEKLETTNQGAPTWRITYYVATNASTQSFQLDPTQPALDWSYPFAPIQTAQNLPNPHEFWGIPDLTESIIGMNESSNFIEGNTKKIVYNQAHSSNIVEGANPNQAPIKTQPDHWTILPPGAKAYAIEAHGDVANSRLFAADLRANMDVDSGVNAVVMGAMSELPRGAISGVAIKMLFMPSLMKTISKRRLLGKLLRKLCQIHLYFAKIDPNGDTVAVNLAWQDPVPVDDLAQWQSAPIEEQMGMSKHTILANRGESYQEELELRQQEAQDDQASYNQGLGPAPQANQFAQQAVPPDMPQAPDLSAPESETGAGAI